MLNNASAPESFMGRYPGNRSRARSRLRWRPANITTLGYKLRGPCFFSFSLAAYVLGCFFFWREGLALLVLVGESRSVCVCVCVLTCMLDADGADGAGACMCHCCTLWPCVVQELKLSVFLWRQWHVKLSLLLYLVSATT